MIEIFPEPYHVFTCPRCEGTETRLQKIIYQGIHLLADLECAQCSFQFYNDFPTGHGVTYPAVVDKQFLQVLSPANMDWYTQPLVQSLKHPSSEPITISKKINSADADNQPVIFFNCLDAWYGHVLLKLMNIQFYHDRFPGYKKIVLIPAGFSWTVPAYAHETWTADIKLRDTKKYYLQLEHFIREELAKYKQVYHSSGYSHPPLQEIRVQDFFKTPAFDLNAFPKRPAKIMFIYREDRLWISPFMNKIFNALNYRKITFANSFFYGLQKSRINKLVKKLKTAVPGSAFYVCGAGKKGGLNADIKDERSNTFNDQQELDWCRLYADMHLVIGIHGSNMLIPSALAAAWLEILPDDRISNISQDLFCKYAFNQMVFLGRFASLYDPVNRVAAIAASMIEDYESFHNHQQHRFAVNK